MRFAASNSAPPASRVPWPWRIAVTLTTLAAGAVFALVVAYWGWRWLGPASVAPPPVASSVDALIAAAPFGRAVPANAASGAAGASSPAARGLPGEARLLGVFAGRNGDGYALLRLPERGAVLLRSGQDIAPGVQLEAVLPGGIRIRDRGEYREILLRPDARPAPVSTDKTARSPVGMVTPQQRAACAMPPGFAGPVYRLNAELLTGMAAQPQSWAALVAPGTRALVVRDQTGLAAMLGMKAGDRLLQANGIALRGVDDVLAAVVRPLTESQPVRLSGTRDGKAREWLFLNAGACPA